MFNTKFDIRDVAINEIGPNIVDVKKSDPTSKEKFYKCISFLVLPILANIGDKIQRAIKYKAIVFAGRQKFVEGPIQIDSTLDWLFKIEVES